MEAGALKRRGIVEVPREVPRLVERFDSNDLLTFASAISFQVLTSIVPLALFIVGLMGFFDLTEVWQSHIRNHIVPDVSPAMLSVIDDTVGKILDSKQLFWVTAGALLATWQLSGAVRASMDVLNRVHGVSEDRPWRARYWRSAWLAVTMTALVMLAVGLVTLGSLIYGDAPAGLGIALLVLRWLIAGALLILAVGLLVHFGPDCPQPLGWVSVGALLVVGTWVVMSVLFLLYLTSVASYGSVFGNLATLVVLMGYLYLSSIAFVSGIQMDALLRERSRES